MNPLFYVLIIGAIGLAIVAEVLVAYQKYQMKKQFMEELDRKDSQAKDHDNASGP
jgi:hypothetical protein